MCLFFHKTLASTCIDLKLTCWCFYDAHVIIKCLRKNWHLNMSNLPIQKAWLSIVFFCVPVFSSYYESCALLVKFIPSISYFWCYCKWESFIPLYLLPNVGVFLYMWKLVISNINFIISFPSTCFWSFYSWDCCISQVYSNNICK